MTAQHTPHERPPELRRVLGLSLTTLYGLGTILGAGIYVLIGEVVRVAGMHAPAAFFSAALIAAMSGLSYAELAARFPRAAGEALYVQEGFGAPALSVAVGLALVLSGLVSSAALANGFAGYARVFVELPAWLLIAAAILALGALAAWGISESAFAAALATLVEVAGLLLVIAVSHEGLASLPERWPELLPGAHAPAWAGVAAGAFLAFYAFIGCEDMVNVAEEVKNPSRTMPRAILLAISISTVLYLIVAAAAVLALPLERLAGAEAPLAELYQHASGASPAVIAAIGLFAVINGALVQMIMGVRVLYGMSRQGWLPGWFGRLHPRRRTPHLATLAVTAAVLVFALLLPMVSLARLTSFIVLTVFAMVNLALVIIKRRSSAPPGVFSCPAWTPVAGFVLSLAMLALELARAVAP